MAITIELAPLGGRVRYSARTYDDGLGVSHVACSCGWQSAKHYGRRAEREQDARRDASEHMRAHLEPGEVVVCGSDDVLGVWCELWPRDAAVDALRALGRLRQYATVSAAGRTFRGIPRVSGTGVVVRIGGFELPVESIKEVDWS